MSESLLMPAGGAGWKITQSFPEKEREREVGSLLDFVRVYNTTLGPISLRERDSAGSSDPSKDIK